MIPSCQLNKLHIRCFREGTIKVDRAKLKVDAEHVARPFVMSCPLHLMIGHGDQVHAWRLSRHHHGAKSLKEAETSEVDNDINYHW